MPFRRRPTLPLLLPALLGVAVLSPPELHPIGMALCTALAGLLGWLVVRDRVDECGSACAALGTVAAFWMLISLRLSPHRHASEALLHTLFLAGVAFLAARQLSRSRQGSDRIADTTILLAGVASLWGLYQVAIGLPRTASALRALGQMELDPMVLRAESGRAFGPFLLPADLGIFLAMALPLACRRLRASRKGAPKAIAAAVLVLLTLGIVASRSYGAVVSLVAAVLVLLPASRVRGKLRIAAGLAVLGAVAGGAVFLSRGAEGLAPLRLRLGNWQAAWSLFVEHPAFGVGPGAYGDAVTWVMTPAMNETIFAHNSYLQIAAESGLPGLLLALLGIGLLARKIAAGLRWDSEPLDRLLLSLPPVAFLLHNLFDFSAYLPSLLVPFAALCAGAGRETVPGIPRPAPRDSGAHWAWQGALVLALVAAVAWGFLEARTMAQLRQAEDHRLEGRPESSLALLERAARTSPGHPDPPAILSELLLATVPVDPEALREGEAWARRARRLRESRAYGHFMVSLYRLAAGDLGEACVALSRARDRYPERELYRIQERRLKDMVRQLASDAGSGDAR